MVDTTTAQWIMHLFDLTENELIDFELPISIVTLGNRYSSAGICNLTTGTMDCVNESGKDNSNPMWYTVSYRISGICESRNDHMFVGYTGGTIFDSNLYQINVINANELNFHYVNFMVDPLLDVHNLTTQFDSYFNPQYSAFRVYSDLTVDATIDTLFTYNPLYLWLSALSTLGILLMICVLIRFDGKTIRQTDRILKIHHYKPSQINRLTTSILGIINSFIIFIILSIVLPIIKAHFILIHSNLTIYLTVIGLTLFILTYLWLTQHLIDKQWS